MTPPLPSFRKHLWSLLLPYWKSNEKWLAYLLLATIVILNLGEVYLNVLFNHWNNSFYNSLQALDKQAFIHNIIRFSYLAIIFIITAVYQIYLNQMLSIRWRRWLTAQFVDRWLNQKNYYHLQLTGSDTDNPDQRISEDIGQFIDTTLALTLGLLSAIVTLISFLTILWSLSGSFDITIANTAIHIPGYMVWAALLYAFLGTWLTHIIGRPLVALNFNQQRVEADFRFSLVRFRENSENIAFHRSESKEKIYFFQRFSAVFNNYWQIMRRQKQLTWFTSFYGQAAILFPFIVASPRFFSKQIQLGGLMQITSAFAQVQGSLSFIINAYPAIANWKATSDRLITFQTQIQTAETQPGFQPRVAGVSSIPIEFQVTGKAPAQASRGAYVSSKASGQHSQDLTNSSGMNLDARSDPEGVKSRKDFIKGNGYIITKQLTIYLPNQQPLLKNIDLQLRPGESLLITGPSGCGKTTLLRTLAGIWPFASGDILLPSQAQLLFLPQKPYLPLGTLCDILRYTDRAKATTDDQIIDLLERCQLSHLCDRLHLDQNWAHVLSLGEQQRIAFARAILSKPDFIFLDEATAALDEANETRLYHLLKSERPEMSVISVGHRTSLAAWHERQWSCVNYMATDFLEAG